jgi:hypothetical protein
VHRCGAPRHVAVRLGAKAANGALPGARAFRFTYD